MDIYATISGHLTMDGPQARYGWLAGPWRIHTGGSCDNVLHELWGYHDDARRWIAEHGLTYGGDALVNP